jgi:DNA-binding MarR family transcriptional regulator
MRVKQPTASSLEPEAFTIDCFDEVLSQRADPAEWARIMSMRAQPNFLNCLKQYNKLMAPFFADKVILNKIVTEAWRFEMLVYTLYLYDQRDYSDSRSGLTVANLERLCAQMNCASPGRVRAILGIMRVGGYLRRSRSYEDQRVVQLEPTPQFLDIVESWNRRIFQISDSVFAEDHLVDWHKRENRLGWEMRNRGCEALVAGWKLLDPFPEVFHFVSSDGGWMLLLRCAFEALRLGNDQHIMPVSVDLSTFGRRYGVSRSHLRRLLESAYEAGLLRAPPKNGANIVLSKELLASYLNCMAAEISFYRSHAMAYLRESGQVNGPRDGLGVSRLSA